MQYWTRRIVAAIGLVLILGTLLPIVPSNEWWIRFFDFPRAQFAMVIAILLVWIAAARLWKTRAGLILTAALTLCFIYQISRILPYTALWSQEVPRAASCDSRNLVSYMEANVLQSNRDAGALLELVKERRPDLLLLTETDAWWSEQVRPLLSDMPHVVSVPLENTYGMMLFSRRPLLDVQVRYLFEPDIPSIRANFRLNSGQSIDLYGVHPRPPLPGQDTAERDAELVLIGREVRARRKPTIVAGDLNDVAWSDTTALFQKVSGLLDPRVGRKLMPTFPANLPLLRWPLDYVFVSPGFSLVTMERLRDIGSDHLPIVVELCASDMKGRYLAPPRLEPDVREKARETMEEGREEAAERE